MAPPGRHDDNEDERLRSAALRTAHSISLERQRLDREVVQGRDHLRITLASMGDAVISTDAEGRVNFLNEAAELLTGWPRSEAAGQPLPEVFRIINESTREPVENPILRALREGRVVGLANHTILIARDGTERPIDDSAAPMRDAAGATIGAVLVFRDVSERKKAEETRARLAAIVESSDDAIVSKSLEGIVRSWNAAAERMFGYTCDEMIGQPITRIIPPERISEEAAILSRVRSGRRVESFETVRQAKDGRRMDISLTISPIRDHEGHVIGASKIARDITDRKRAEAALRESEGRHRFLADLATTLQPLTDPNKVMATTAHLLAEHLNVDRCAYAEVEDESIFVIAGDHARGVPSIVGRWPVAAFGAECSRCMLANEPYVIDDVDTDRRAGRDLEAYRQANIQAVICVPLHKAGRFVAAMAVHQKTVRHWTRQDVQLVSTVVGRSWESLERTRVARGLAESARELALALAAAKLGDWSWDARSDRVTLSVRAAEIFGIPPGTQLTWPEMVELLHVDDRQAAREAVQRAVAENRPYDVKYRLTHRDGALVWVSAKGLPQYDATGTPVSMFGVVQDITERMRLEQELRQRATELAEADRKKDDFIALLAHELRNPLAPVRTGLQVMRLAAGDPIKVARARETMDRQLSHMVRLIDDLLDVSRLNRNKLNLQKAKVLLAEVVSHALEAVGPAIEAAGHDLQVTMPSEPVYLDADLTRMAQVFGNLLSNSAKYTARGGRIRLAAELDGNQVVVLVSDTGIGIPAGSLTSVFDMFAQVDRSVERASGGLGIGLALVKGLVEMHGGTVTAASPGPGEGSTFTVRLPLAERRSDAASRAPEPSPTSLLVGARVLVVDDNRDGAETMASLLGLLGNEVHVAHDGVEAVETAERIRPHLVLMDVGLPRLSGLDATRQIRERPWGEGITIIALTGWGQDGDRARSQAAGCDGHLVKPISLPQLEELLVSLRARDAGPAQMSPMARDGS